MAATLLKTNSVTIAAQDNAATVSGIPSPGFVAVQIVGALSATITFEASVDGTNYVAFNMTPSNSGTDASTTTAVSILFRLRVGGVDKGTNGYYYSHRYIPMTVTGGQDDGSANAAYIVPGLVATTANAGVATIDIHDPQKTAITSLTYQGAWSGTTSASGNYNGGGFLNDTVAYDGFSLTANTGNLTALTVYVYGYRES